MIKTMREAKNNKEKIMGRISGKIMPKKEAASFCRRNFTEEEE